MWIVLLWLENGTEKGFLTAVRRRNGSIRTFTSYDAAEDFINRYRRPKLGSSLILDIG
jgi:hypothetical protein